MKKQYIKASNESPHFHIGAWAWWATTLYVFKAPSWSYGVLVTFAVLAEIGTIYRLANENGIDLVNRKDT